MSSTRFRHQKLAILACLILTSLTAESCRKAEISNSKPVTKGVASVMPKIKSPLPPKLHTFARPKNVRGLYVTAWVAGGQKHMDALLGLADRTEINAFVIDVRDEGQMYFKTGIKLADESKANQIAVVNPEKLMNRLFAHNIWPIARVACFRDNYVTVKHPELAVQFANGKVWRDRSKHAWLDPYNQKNWQYMSDTIDFALDMGFPEIQLDYVRFPSEGKAATQVYPGKKFYKDQKAAPADVIQAFAVYIAKRVHDRGAVLSADIFGIISSTKTDQGIGQFLEKVAEPFDVISPMIYPSHFALGEYGISDPDQAPYGIVQRSLKDFQKRLPKKDIRPWLQSFSLRNHYGPTQVRAQIKAAEDLGYHDFLLWNAQTVYPEAGLLKKKKSG